MQAFHNDPAIKLRYLARVEHHIAADNLVRGLGWSDGKGCAVGCTLEAYDHSRYPVEIGIPEWLARLEDGLFEGMSEQKSRTWPREFLAAITPGDDLERIKSLFMIAVLRSTLDNFDNERFPEVARAVSDCIALWERPDIGSKEWKTAAWSAAKSAESAESAAESAKSAAWSAAWSAAKSAAWSAAKSAARSAAKSAESGAWSAAKSAANDHFADALLDLLRTPPSRQVA